MSKEATIHFLLMQPRWVWWLNHLSKPGKQIIIFLLVLKWFLGSRNGVGSCCIRNCRKSRTRRHFVSWSCIELPAYRTNIGWHDISWKKMLKYLCFYWRFLDCWTPIDGVGGTKLLSCYCSPRSSADVLRGETGMDWLSHSVATIAKGLFPHLASAPAWKLHFLCLSRKPATL